jgi:hypothetical protein
MIAWLAKQSRAEMTSPRREAEPRDAIAPRKAVKR